MRLCIADPPYLGVAALWYGDAPFHGEQRITGVNKADNHPDAHIWDDPETHRLMVEHLLAEYDGFAIAMKVASLWHYLRWVGHGPGVHVCAWVKPTAMPTNSHPFRSWEPVLIKVPEGRRRGGREVMTRDWLHASAGGEFAGAKPKTWTRWVLDILGYNPDTDTVDDLFHGSGAVAAEINQNILNLEWSRQA
jgi:hypothetical protein